MDSHDRFSNGLVCFISFVLLLFVSIACIHQYRLEKKQSSWPSVQGKITSWDESDVTVSPGSGPARRKRNKTYIDISYEFQLGDATYTGRAHFNSKASPRWIERGKRHLTEYDDFPITVFYNPLNPRQNVLERAKFSFDWYYWPFFILCPLGIFFYFHDSSSKSSPLDSRRSFVSHSVRPSSPSKPSSPIRPISRSPLPSRSSRFFSWIHNNQFVVVSLIILLAVALYCLATRYTVHPELPCSVDRWTGRLIDSDSQ